MAKKHLIPGFALILFLAIPAVARWLESTMVGQMLVQIPALILGGYFVGRGLTPILSRKIININSNGIPGLLLAVFIINFWSLPRSADAALTYPLMELAKYVSLTVLAGIPLAISWFRLHFIVRGFVWANLLSMLLVMSWLYLNSPVRLCTNYLIQDQIIMGRLLLIIAFVIIVIMIWKLFLVDHRTDHN